MENDQYGRIGLWREASRREKLTFKAGQGPQEKHPPGRTLTLIQGKGSLRCHEWGECRERRNNQQQKRGDAEDEETRTDHGMMTRMPIRPDVASLAGREDHVAVADLEGRRLLQKAQVLHQRCRAEGSQQGQNRKKPLIQLKQANRARIGGKTPISS